MVAKSQTQLNTGTHTHTHTHIHRGSSKKKKVKLELPYNPGHISGEKHSLKGSMHLLKCYLQ